MCCEPKFFYFSQGGGGNFPVGVSRTLTHAHGWRCRTFGKIVAYRNPTPSCYMIWNALYIFSFLFCCYLIFIYRKSLKWIFASIESIFIISNWRWRSIIYVLNFLIIRLRQSSNHIQNPNEELENCPFELPTCLAPADFKFFLAEKNELAGLERSVDVLYNSLNTHLHPRGLAH